MYRISKGSLYPPPCRSYSQWWAIRGSSRSRNPSQPHLRARGLRWFNDSISQPRGATTLRGWITWGSAWRSRGLLISVDRFLKGQQGTGNGGELSDPGGGVGPVSPSSSHPYLDNGEGDPKLSISNYTFQSHPRSSSPMRLPVTTWFLIFPSPKAASGEPANNRVHTRLKALLKKKALSYCQAKEERKPSP